MRGPNTSEKMELAKKIVADRLPHSVFSQAWWTPDDPDVVTVDYAEGTERNTVNVAMALILEEHEKPITPTKPQWVFDGF